MYEVNLKHLPIYSIRKAAEECCSAMAGTELKALQDPVQWDSVVRSKLEKPAKVKEMFSQIVDN